MTTPALQIRAALAARLKLAMPTVAVLDDPSEAFRKNAAIGVVVRPQTAQPADMQVLGLTRVDQSFELLFMARGIDPVAVIEQSEALAFKALMLDQRLGGLLEQLNWQGESWEHAEHADGDYAMKTVRWQVIYRQRETERILA